MRVAERNREPAESHFTEGELDLEPPEELAVVEIDDDTILEEDLDNEDVLEQDVDEDTLEVTLEDLIHAGDDSDGDDTDDDGDGIAQLKDSTPPPGDAADDADPEEAGDEVEAELDVTLLERLALDDLDDAEDVDEVDGGHATTNGRRARERPTRAGDEVAEVAPCGADEFVCPSCFLVRRRVQLAGPGATVCRDCA